MKPENCKEYISYLKRYIKIMDDLIELYPDDRGFNFRDQKNCYEDALGQFESILEYEKEMRELDRSCSFLNFIKEMLGIKK